MLEPEYENKLATLVNQEIVVRYWRCKRCRTLNEDYTDICTYCDKHKDLELENK